jgi:AAA domain
MSRRDINDPGYWEDAARMKAGIDPLDDLGEQGPTPRNNEPRNRAPPIGKPINRSGKQSGAAKFKLVPFREIRFTAGDEWRIKRVIPRQGVAVLIGSPKAFKSFIALNISFHIALGWDWAGRKTLQGAAIYIAAENVGGTRKRKAGFEAANFEDLPDEVPFYLIETAPNLGIEKHDRAALITSIEAVGVRPGIIVIDTLAQSLGGGEENNAGMVTFVANATALAAHFKTCVLIVHHVGLSDDRRSRGHTSLPGGADAMLLTER